MTSPTEPRRPDRPKAADSRTRVDLPHASGSAEEFGASGPSLDLLEAIAGHDAEASTQQLKKQALELAGILRDKQKWLDHRESELNARAARLENEQRVARLKEVHQGPPRISTSRGDEPVAAEATGGQADARTAESAVAPAKSPHPKIATPDALEAFLSEPYIDDRRLIETELSSAVRQAEEAARQAYAEEVRQRMEASPADSPNADVTPLASGKAATSAEMEEEYDHLERQRQILREREAKLARREDRTNKMHDEVTLLHREALELRLATEQVWADLMEELPEERLAHSMAEIRAKLADHYRLANDTMARRKDELHELRAELNRQDQRLRQQRRDIQMWLDRRYDEIEARTAKLILRERELDQLESEFERQSLEWQEQREAYRQELEQLNWRQKDRAPVR